MADKVADKKAYVVYIEHVVHGTEPVGICLTKPSTQTMRDLMEAYVRRYSFDQGADANNLEYKQVLRTCCVSVPILD